MFAVASGAPGPTGLEAEGALMPVVVTGPKGSQTVTAQIDTGSSISSVDLAILQALGCPQVGSVPISTVTGTETAPLYTAGLATLGGVDLSEGLPGVLGDSLTGSVSALIGVDILARFDLIYEGPQGVWQLDAGGVAAYVPAGFSGWWVAIAAGTAAALTAAGILELGRRARRAALARKGRSPA